MSLQCTVKILQTFLTSFPKNSAESKKSGLLRCALHKNNMPALEKSTLGLVNPP
jgi:hypothetical protein